MAVSDHSFISAEEAFRLGWVGTRADLAEACQNARGVAALILRAEIAHFDGKVDLCVGLLRNELRRHEDVAIRAMLAELLAPILVMRREAAEVADLSEILETAGRCAAAASFRALAAVISKDRDKAFRQIGRASALLNHEGDALVRVPVLQRLALACFQLNDFGRASDRALAAADEAVAIGSWRTAAASYSILYCVQLGVVGDFVEADRFAKLTRVASERAGDQSFVFTFLVAEFELAVKFGDEIRAASLERLMDAASLPQQYRERFTMMFSLALQRGAHDLVMMRTLLDVLRDTDGRTRGEWAMCTALIALAEVSEGADFAARRSLEAAIGRLGRSSSREPADEQHHRRLARGLVASCCILLGENVRAARVVGVSEMQKDVDTRQLFELVCNARLTEVAKPLMGAARVLERVVMKRRESLSPEGLTSAEFEVLQLLGSGWSAGRIARETERSVNTVYNHTRAILAKLDAARAPEAVAIARARGIIA